MLFESLSRRQLFFSTLSKSRISAPPPRSPWEAKQEARLAVRDQNRKALLTQNRFRVPFWRWLPFLLVGFQRFLECLVGYRSFDPQPYPHHDVHISHLLCPESLLNWCPSAGNKLVEGVRVIQPASASHPSKPGVKMCMFLVDKRASNKQ